MPPPISPDTLERLHAEMREHFPELKGIPGTITYDHFGKPIESMTTSIPRAGHRHEGYNLYLGPQVPPTESGLKRAIAHELAHVVLNLGWLRQHPLVIPYLFSQSAHEGTAEKLCRQLGLGHLLDVAPAS